MDNNNNNNNHNNDKKHYKRICTELENKANDHSEEQFLKDILKNMPSFVVAEVQDTFKKYEKFTDPLFRVIKSLETKDSLVIHKALNDYLNHDEDRKDNHQRWTYDLLILYNILYFTEEKLRNYFLVDLIQDSRFLSPQSIDPSKLFLNILESRYMEMGFFMVSKFPEMNVTTDHLELMYQYEHIELLLFTIEKYKKYDFIPCLVDLACFPHISKELTLKLARFMDTCYDQGHSGYSFKDSKNIFDILFKYYAEGIDLETVKFFTTLNTHPSTVVLLLAQKWGKKDIFDYLVSFLSPDDLEKIPSPPPNLEILPHEN